VTANNLVADGGDALPVMKLATDRLGGAVDTDALEGYFAAFSPVSPGCRRASPPQGP